MLNLRYFCKLSTFLQIHNCIWTNYSSKKVSLFACLIFARLISFNRRPIFLFFLFIQCSRVVGYSLSVIRFHGRRKRASEYKINYNSIQQSRKFNFQERNFLFSALSIVLSLLMQQVRNQALWRDKKESAILLATNHFLHTRSL